MSIVGSIPSGRVYMSGIEDAFYSTPDFLRMDVVNKERALCKPIKKFARHYCFPSNLIENGATERTRHNLEVTD